MKGKEKIKMSKAILIGACGGDFSPKKGIDYWTPEDVESINRIVRDKSSMIGGFIPVRAPIWKDGAKLNATLATVTSITEEDGQYIVTFNEKEEQFSDGSFENYKVGDALVPLKSFARGDSGWSGFAFDGATTRYLNVLQSTSASLCHCGDKFIVVKSPYSSICKSVRLKANTNYTLSFWCRGVAGDHFSNVCILGKTEDSDVYYEDRGGAFLCYKNSPHYRVLRDMWYHAGNEGEYLEAANTWQQFTLTFNTYDREFIDICIYFGKSYNEFYFDDFSIVEDTGQVFSAYYPVGDELPSVVTLGAIFYIERESEFFYRFDHASSKAISDLYRDIENKMTATLEAMLLSPLLNGDEVSY